MILIYETHIKIEKQASNRAIGDIFVLEIQIATKILLGICSCMDVQLLVFY